MAMCAAEGVTQSSSRRRFVIVTCHGRRVAIAMAIELSAETTQWLCGSEVCDLDMSRYIPTLGFCSYRDLGQQGNSADLENCEVSRVKTD